MPNIYTYTPAVASTDC